MEIIKHIKVPTGDILIVKGELGQLEMLSLGDYGKDINIKANFLNLERIPQPVKHQQLMPLTEKWVITISTQYGCSMRCNFCDVPKVGPGKNATFRDLTDQVITGIRLHPEIQSTKRLNIHFARMGEPTWNPNVLDAAKWFKDHIDPEYKVHPVVSTMMPRKNIWLKTFIHNWARIKNRLYGGNAGLQLSINSTNENERQEMFSGNACTLKEISQIMEGIIPAGRKITLNFAVGPYEINPEILLEHFNPRDFLIKLTPLHKTNACLDNQIISPGDYTTYEPYEEYEKNLRIAGYDVLVFIASIEEDLSRITCGNAILSGTLPFDTMEKINVK
jgi:23S rRNA (adenine2503-C2)-methyltransferase